MNLFSLKNSFWIKLLVSTAFVFVVFVSVIPQTSFADEPSDCKKNELYDDINKKCYDPYNKADLSAAAGKKSEPFCGITAAIASMGISTVMCGIATTLILLPMTLTGWVLWLGGEILNAAMTLTVVDVSKNLSGIKGINTAWRVLRDLSNMVFIFILIYTAIRTILGDGSGKLKQTIVGVVIVAILINFSMFFTKLIIDASNIVTLTFYEKISPLSDRFMQPLGLTTAFDIRNFGSTFTELSNSLGRMAVVSIGTSVFFVILAFVFFSVAIMFLIRYVNFIFLIILSPLAFVGSILPGMGGQIRGWWTKNLTSQAVFAPLYMILTWAVLTIMNNGGITGKKLEGSSAKFADLFMNTTAGAGGATGGANAFDIAMNFIILIAFAVGSLIIARTVANQSGSIGSQVVGKAMGGVGAIGRRTLGSVGRTMADNEKLKDAASKGGFTGLGARMALRTSSAAAKSSFDARAGLSAVGKFAGDEKFTDIGAGKAGGKGGYDQMVKDDAKKLKEFGDSLGSSDITKDTVKQEFKAAQDLEKKAREKGESSDEYKKAQERVAKARDRMDQIIGVNEEEAKKRITERLKTESRKRGKEISDDDIKEYFKGEKGKTELKDAQVKSSADARKEAYAETIVNPEGVVNKLSNRFAYFGPIKRANRQAAADLRKSKKSVKDLVDEALKESGETPKEKSGEGDGGGKEGGSSDKKEGSGGKKPGGPFE